MALETATNTFTGGMILDINEIDSTNNTTCSKALNATVATFNGHEGAILNEMGNVKIINKYNNEDIIAQLPEGSIVLGSAEYGGVIYYVLLLDDNTNAIGSFPSPDYSLREDESFPMIWQYLHLQVGEDETGKKPLIFDMGYNLQHAVNILVEPSFDGSVNLILNDGENKPRMINSGFQVQNNNFAKVIKRYSDNNTNRYNIRENNSDFDLQTSLYRNFNRLSKFKYNGTVDGGDLKVGNYVFYAVSCDKDGNESDIICESGVISIFIGEDSNPFSVNGGVGNLNSYKSIDLSVLNVDSAYSYVKLYYSRTTAQNDLLAETLIYKVNKLYECNNGTANILFTGKEPTEPVDHVDTLYFIASGAKAQAINQNMLFLANVLTDSEDKSAEYEILREFSNRIIPVPFINNEFSLKSDYSGAENSYYNSKFIYEKTGYHENQFYRFGIVYIRKDGSLTSVFNTLGYIQNNNEVPSGSLQSIFEYNTDSIEEVQCMFTDEEQHKVNNYGILKIGKICNNITNIIGINFIIPENTILNNYKGYFFVRQKRIPSILAQGYATNICEEAYLPSINVPLHNNSGGISEVALHLYESFVCGDFLSGTNIDSNIYPEFTNSANSTFTLRNTYKRRLFSLVQNNTKVFFDRLSSNDSIFGAFYEHINGEITSVEAGSGTRYEIYGGTNDDLYLTFYSNNATSSGNMNSGASAYRADFYYFVKVNLIKSLDDLPSTAVQILKNGTENNFAGFKLYDDRTIYKDNKNSYYLLIDSSEYSDNVVIGIDGGKWIYDDLEGEQVLRETYYKKILDGLEVNNYDTKVLSGADLAWDWADDLVYPCACSLSDLYSSKLIDVSRQPWGRSGTFLCPEWVKFGSDYYTYVAFGPGHSIDDYNGIQNMSLYTLVEYVRKYNNNNYGSSEFEDNNIPKPAYDLTTSEFNGKYGYTTDINKIDEVALPYNPIEQYAYGVLCPEFELNRPYYNNFFTGLKLKVEQYTTSLLLNNGDNQRLYKYDNTNIDTSRFSETVIEKQDNSRAISVNENVSLVAIQHEVSSDDYKDHHLVHNKNSYFSSKAGSASEVGFKFAGAEFLAKSYGYPLIPERPFNIVRGIYGSYVGVFSQNNIANRIVNIYAPGYTKALWKQNLAKDTSAYYTISDRIEVETEKVNDTIICKRNTYDCYRGDCYIGYFTHRINRNFQDPTAPYNDTIIDTRSFANGFKDCFSLDYRTFDTTKDGAKNFNLGDINAIQLGSWITFPVRSTINISLRAVDKSWVDERLLCGNDRSFYPLHTIDVSGSYKIPESEAYNAGFNKSGSEKHFFNINQIVYNKVYYKNRICYSNVLQSSALSNGNRVFLSEHYRDYTELYGEIIKLISLAGNLLVICEHGILLVPVNERALAAEGDGGNIFINTSNVLPDNPKIISDTYGSLWEESVVQTPYGVFGVDAVNKKIWYTDGDKLQTISDFKVQEFLNNYLSVTHSKEIGKCNIKTHYIKVKNDVIFTLYDTTNDNYWNLCWNINDSHFKTFYSWIPYDSQNIGNNLISVPLPILLENERTKDVIEGGSIQQGEVTKYDSDGIVDGDKLELHREDYLWKHGHSNAVPTSEEILPTNFYGNQHPFEFEFIVKDHPEVHKIFDNLQIISNKTAPESFHYEIIGECYDFGKLKEVAYIRQEALKQLYNTLDEEIKCNNTDDIKVHYNQSNQGRAIIFPLYYQRRDVVNLMYDEYKNMFAPDYNYDALSGTEIVRYKKLNEFRLVNHVKAVDVRGKGGLLKGNMQYKEDKWDVQINPINYVVGNESSITWKDNRPPVLLSNIQLSDEYKGKDLYVPEGYNNNIYARWKISERKEVNVKDKFIKIKIRYSGKNLAVISAINTLYRISYA